MIRKNIIEKQQNYYMSSLGPAIPTEGAAEVC